ncbi:MAG: DoxX family protein [bacterium]
MKPEQLNSAGLLIARLALGLVMFAHGAQKLLGWFGGKGWSHSLEFMTGDLGIPAVFAVLAILAEFFGGLMIIIGAVTRLAALVLIIEQVVAALMVQLPSGFFMNWSPTMSTAGHGVEMNLVLIGLAATLFCTGAGAYALDARLNLDFVGRLLGMRKSRPAIAG